MHSGWDEHQALASRSRIALLETLRDHGEAMGVDELSDAIGLHVNTTREHLDRLVGAGLVSRAPEHRTTRGRPRILYRYCEPAGSRVRALLDEVLLAGYGEPMESAAQGANEAGRAAVDLLLADRDLPTAQDPSEAVEMLVTELDRLGFAPRVEGGAVRLCRCPVEDLARRRSEVVCAAHLGMTAALVERIGGLTLTDAEPFADEAGCLLHLEPITSR